MKRIILLIFILTVIIGSGCGGGSAPKNTAEQPAANAEPKKTPEDGFYEGKGVVTKINLDLGSVELDHQEIPNLMPAMKMEFTVKDKALLKSFNVGDAVVFTVEYKQGKETIIAIGK